VLKGKPVFAYNALMLAQFRWEGKQQLTAGKQTIVFDFTIAGPGIAKGGSGVLRVDGQGVATLKIPKSIPFLLPGDETFDVGVDTRTPVNDKDYQVPFAFNGKINKLTFDLGPVHLSAEEQKAAAKAIAVARDLRRKAESVYLSKAKMRFQSSFMLMTIQPFLFASAINASEKVPT
jgi:arylsulfatase